MLTFYQNLPLHIDPIAFTVGSFSVRWYALSYLVGFGVVYSLLIFRIKRGEYGAQNYKLQITNYKQIQNSKLQSSKEIQNTKYKIQDTKYPPRLAEMAARRREAGELRDTILDFLLLVFFAAIVGGRIGYILFYNLNYFINNPMAIVWPFENGNFVGISGMSYHGGLIGVLLGSWIFLKIRKKISARGGSAFGGNFWQWTDFVVPAVPLGYFFGRIGNFLNGELYGRVTNSSLGMYFAADKMSLRWPSQLIEGFLEGIVLFVVLWLLRKKEIAKGRMLGFYLIGYGFLRIVGEFFREPDPQLGFFLSFLTLGQVLSLIMIVVGAIFLLKRIKK